MNYRVLIGGEAGYGIMTSGLLLSKIATHTGLHIFDYVQYPSLIRGGHNAYEIMMSDREVGTLTGPIDLLVCFDKTTYEVHKNLLAQSAIVLHDPKEFTIENSQVRAVSVPFRDILTAAQGSYMMKNTVLMGSLLAVMGGDVTWMHNVIAQEFGKKGQAIVDANIFFVNQGYEFVTQNFADVIYPIFANRTLDSTQSVVMTGNDAFALGSVLANCRFYAAYPMTPSSTVLATLAGWQEKVKMVVRHSEDEIAVINSAIGASFTGVRCAVGTSGGGFALMVEGMSLAGITESAIVVFLSQRPGPATGMPTWTEQGDLLFAVHAGHGEFPKIVLAPGDIEEMVTLTSHAYNLADIYQTPVIVLSDMLLSESHRDIARSTLQQIESSYVIDRGKYVTEAEPTYERYAWSEDGISQRLQPGVSGVYFQANSYTHEANGHTSESAEDRLLEVAKRNAKTSTYLKNHFELPQVYGELAKASHILVGWGSTKAAAQEAQRILAESDVPIAYVHFTHVFPLDKAKLASLFTQEHLRKMVSVEQNSHAQFARLLRQETGYDIQHALLRYDGRPITAHDIVQFIAQSTQKSTI